jgi:hypothetical protein
LRTQFNGRLVRYVWASLAGGVGGSIAVVALDWLNGALNGWISDRVSGNMAGELA